MSFSNPDSMEDLGDGRPLFHQAHASAHGAPCSRLLDAHDQAFFVGALSPGPCSDRSEASHSENDPRLTSQLYNTACSPQDWGILSFPPSGPSYDVPENSVGHSLSVGSAAHYRDAVYKSNDRAYYRDDPTYFDFSHHVSYNSTTFSPLETDVDQFHSSASTFWPRSGPHVGGIDTSSMVPTASFNLLGPATFLTEHPVQSIHQCYDVTSTEHNSHVINRPSSSVGDDDGSSPSSHPDTTREPSHAQKADRHPFRCIVCGAEHSSYPGLSSHAWIQDHKTLRCRGQSCDFLYSSADGAYRKHLTNSHPELYNCSECNSSFNEQWIYQNHISQTGHTAFTCPNAECGKTFSRIDTYERHQKTHMEEVKRYPCKYCRKYRGENGFKRKDHLTQHLRNYHHIGENDPRKGTHLWNFRRSCPHKDCGEYRAPGTLYHMRVFQKSSDHVQHMRKVHDESDFPCPEPGCDRIGGKGYFRTADLRAHLRKVHGTNGALEGDEK